MKFGPVSRVVIVTALVLCALLAIRLIEALPVPLLARISGISAPTRTTPTPTQKAAASHVSEPDTFSLGVVAIETFSGPARISHGSGAVVSSDGLIVTTLAAAPYGSGSYVYQVATATGTLLRARNVWHSSGLVLLKVTATDLNPVFFDASQQVVAGESIKIVGAFVALSRYTPIVLPGTLAYATSSEVAISFDRSFTLLVPGARVLDGQGHSLGIVQLAGSYIRLLSAQVINSVMDQYLATQQK